MDDKIAALKDEVAYLKNHIEMLRKISVFYENELERILDHEDFEHLMKECLHMLLLDPHKYDDE
jgi:hypothetical protein